jgi:phosphate transport system substrate-binding protein
MKYPVCLSLMLLITACSDNNKTIKVKGSDTEVNLAVDLAENFYKVNDDFSLAISGGGSGLGIASLLNGQVDIANSSRPLNAEEDSLFKARGIKIKTVIFAEDATAFVVKKNFPLDSIDVATLTKVLSGEYKTWKKVTGQDIPVNIYGRQSNSGTHSFVSKKLKIEFSHDAKEMNGNAQIIEG